MKVLISHPTGNSFVRAALDGLYDADLLYQFYTSVASFPGTTLDQLGTIKVLSEIHRRRFDLKIKPYTHTWPWKETGRILVSKVSFLQGLLKEKGFLSVDDVYSSMDRRVASKIKAAADNGVSAVYAYEDGACSTFQEAKKYGVNCLYDLPIGYWRSARQILEKERERRPEWSATLTGLRDPDHKLKKKDEELRLADCIFVASTFTAKTLNDYPGKLAPIKVIPYAFPPANCTKEYRNLQNKPLKLLFVGGLSQRKGIADLFEVVEKLGHHVELTVVGRKTTNDCVALNKALTKYKWIPSLPHNEVLEIMREHDVLLFPSLFEGFGLVITEAMAQGTPVITTNHTAGPDIIENGKNGWVINAGSTDELMGAIETLLQRPELIAENGREAVRAAEKRSWAMYGKELVEAMLMIG